MRIGINLLSWEPGRRGGVETYNRNLLRALVGLDSGDTFVLFLSQEARGQVGLDSPRVEEVVCPVRSRQRIRRALWEQFRLGSSLARSGVEVLFCPHSLVPQVSPVPLVQVVHDLQVFDLPGNFRWWKRAYLHRQLPASARRAARIIAVSEFSRASVVRHLGVPAEKVTVVLEAAAPEYSPRPEAEIAGIAERYGVRCPYVLSLATSHQHKRLDHLVRVWDRLVGEKGWVEQLVLGGLPGSGQAELEAAVAACQFPDSVRHLGRLPAADLPALYSGAQGFVYPSLYEGFGLPLLEAMACGCPVLSSDCAALPEIAAEAALLYPGASDEALAAGLVRLVEEPELRADLCAKGLQRAEALSWTQTAQETLAVLRNPSERGTGVSPVIGAVSPRG